MQLEDGGFAVFAFPVHGNEFSVEFYFVKGVGGALLDKVGIDVVEPSDQDIDLYVGCGHVLVGESFQRAILVNGVNDGPVHGEAFDLCAFEVEVIVAIFFGQVVLYDFEADVDPDLDIGEGMIILVGGKAEHEGGAVFKRADQGMVTEQEEGAGAGETSIDKTGGEGKGQEAAHAFYSCNKVGPSADGVDAAVTDGGKCLGAEEEGFLEMSPCIGGNETLELVEANEQVDAAIDQVDTEIEQNEHPDEFPPGQGQHIVVDAVPGHKGDAFLADIEGAVTVDKSSAIISGIGSEAGVIIGFEEWIYLRRGCHGSGVRFFVYKFTFYTSASYKISMGCWALRPAPSFIWWRQLVPGAAMRTSSGCLRTVGSRTSSPIFWEMS